MAGQKTSIYLTPDVAERVRASGVPLPELVRRGLDAGAPAPFEDTLRRVLREELGFAAHVVPVPRAQPPEAVMAPKAETAPAARTEPPVTVPEPEGTEPDRAVVIGGLREKIAGIEGRPAPKSRNRTAAVNEAAKRVRSGVAAGGARAAGRLLESVPPGTAVFKPAEDDVAVVAHAVPAAADHSGKRALSHSATCKCAVCQPVKAKR